MRVNNRKPNRLIQEKSPYLIQHAYNPVNWYSWGNEAFERAKKEGKPIFLSIGYSTCHWCHVMEKESFEDDVIAEQLNRDFVSIKVDREERPDIDHIYMEVCQSLTGSGGWPLSIFLNADREPFFAGTYFPKNDRMGRMGFTTVLNQISKLWKLDPNYIKEVSDKIMKGFKQSTKSMERGIDDLLLQTAYKNFYTEFDEAYGGFGSAPKFPMPHNIYFLLRYWYITNDKDSLRMVEKTLDSMARGGIFDQIGYGFSRYSTDSKWLVPHFEKMLYDNALLAIAYLECYQITRKKTYSETARYIFAYINREMTDKEGGFYSAEDADSEGREGEFYIWSKQEVMQTLGDVEGEEFCRIYHIDDVGNFEGKSIPNRMGFENSETYDLFEGCRQKLFELRERRIHPNKDDKILSGWNGLMIAAFSIAARVLNEETYKQTAQTAVDFISNHMMNEEGRLLARYRKTDAAFFAYAQDYAFFIWGLIELYETSFDATYLLKAVKLAEDSIQYFWDEEEGGLFLYGTDSESLITRPKEIYDGALPSGNSVAAYNFFRLAKLTGNPKWEDYGNQILHTFGEKIEHYPTGYSFALLAAFFNKTVCEEIILVTVGEDTELSGWINILRENYRPFMTVVLIDEKSKHILSKIAPFFADYKTIDGKITAYVCKNSVCNAPITQKDMFRQMLISY
ncbi:MAG: thioredoxin domain-containing protein [Velocimicrobium sp.]